MLLTTFMAAIYLTADRTLGFITDLPIHPDNPIETFLSLSIFSFLIQMFINEHDCCTIMQEVSQPSQPEQTSPARLGVIKWTPT